MLSMKWASIATLTLAFATVGFAQVNVDGTLDSSYGSALALQQNVTGFGTANGSGGVGSELDGAYAQISGGNLYIMLTGDLQQSGNKLDLWIDTGAAGQNVISGLTQGSTDNVANWNGATLSAGFNASQEFELGGSSNFTVFQSTLSGGTWTTNSLGTNNFGSGNGTLSGSSAVQVAINNSNVGGQTSSNLSTYAPGVTTGIEYGISLAALGNPTGDIKIIAAVNGGHADFLSNQFLGSLTAGTGNLGDDNNGNYNGGSLAGINLSKVGNPMFVVHQQAAPEPITLIVLGVGALALVLRKRA